MAIVGIDLGTTNSLVGIIQKGKPRLFAGENGETLIPSVVAIRTDGTSIVGADAKALKSTEIQNTIYSAKRFIGRGKADVTEWMDILPFDFSRSDDQVIRFTAGEKVFTPIEISSLILKKLKALAEAELAEEIKKAVITVPAYFNDAQRQATKFAGELAGLEVLRIVNEPTAACLAYGLDKKAKGVVAVFDLGGGTFDISILRISDGIFEVLATNGDTSLGGDDFDHAIARALRAEISKEFGIDPWTDNQDRARLISAAETLKRTLSDETATEFTFTVEGKTFSRNIARTEVEGWIADILRRAEGPCRQCLTDAGIEPNQISDVILVGGSTRMPRVRETVKAIFKREPICTLNPDEVVAMGAAVQANVLAGQQGGILLLDVIPLSLGIETMGGVVSKIIHRNSTIPVSASEHFTTYLDGQVAVDIHVVQGERELVGDCRSLARFKLAGLPPLPAGIPKIEVEFIVDANGILNVRAMELRTGTTASVLVNPTYGLNDAQVERMLMEAYEKAESDFERRFLIEARTEADTILRATEKSLQRGGGLVSEREVTEIQAAISALRESLAATDFKIIKAQIEKLNQATHHLAEELMNQAVGQALKDKTVDTLTGDKK